MSLVIGTLLVSIEGLLNLIGTLVVSAESLRGFSGTLAVSVEGLLGLESVLSTYLTELLRSGNEEIFSSQNITQSEERYHSHKESV